MADISKIQVPGSATQYNIKDAQARRDIEDVKADLDALEPGLSDTAKAALLACFRNVAWVNDGGQNYYDALEMALGTLSYPKIVATFNPGVNIIYTDDALNTLKQYMIVKYIPSQGASETTISSNDYTLSGVLSEGANAVIVSYGNYKTVISVTAVDFYNIYTWSLSNGNLLKIHGSVDTDQTNATMYPSLALILENYEPRRTYCVSRGMAPFYEKNQNAVPSLYYPIPIPAKANHVKCTTDVAEQFIELYVHEINGDLQYNPRLNKTIFTEMTNGVFERGITTSNNQRFLAVKTKYGSSGTSFLEEPENMLIEFSEV